MVEAVWAEAGSRVAAGTVAAVAQTGATVEVEATTAADAGEAERHTSGQQHARGVGRRSLVRIHRKCDAWRLACAPQSEVDHLGQLAAVGAARKPGAVERLSARVAWELIRCRVAPARVGEVGRRAARQ